MARFMQNPLTRIKPHRKKPCTLRSQLRSTPGVLMATSPKKPSATPLAEKPAAKKTVATKTKAAAKVAAPVAAKAVPVATPAAVVASKPAVKATAKKVSAAKTKLKPSSSPAPVLTSEQRTHYVSVAAFYIAERRGFTLGNPADDWLAAEAEVDRLIASGHFTA